MGVQSRPHRSAGLDRWVVLVFADHYPPGVFDLVMGMNRWVFQVNAYAALMTDQYSPFRLDMGGHDPPPPQAGTMIEPDPLPAH
jgi:hypothetical protein